MSKTVTIKLSKVGLNVGPFNIYDQKLNLIGENVSKEQLSTGVTYLISKEDVIVTIKSTGGCKSEKTVKIVPSDGSLYKPTKVVTSTTACVWRHLTDRLLYNNFYGVIEPYIIEYPFAYQYQDEIVQNVKDYTKVYKHLVEETQSVSSSALIETNDFFNKAILYNGQQCSGMLILEPKPRNSLKSYLKYPVYQDSDKTILFTKEDNFYQYNTFWNVQKSPSTKSFKISCESMSIDKVLNQDNMDYGRKSFKKQTLRAKELKVRHILDNRSDLQLVSQFIITPSQISYI